MGWEPVGSQPTPFEDDINEFFKILALDSLDPQEALAQKISIRRNEVVTRRSQPFCAWVTARARLIETPKQAADRKEEAGSDSEEDVDPSTRRRLLDIFRRRRRFSIPTHQQPSGKMMAKFSKHRKNRVATCYPLKDVVVTTVRTRRF